MSQSINNLDFLSKLFNTFAFSTVIQATIIAQDYYSSLLTGFLTPSFVSWGKYHWLHSNPYHIKPYCMVEVGKLVYIFWIPILMAWITQIT